MGFAKVEALLQAFKRPQWFRSRGWNLRLHRTYIFPTGFGIAFGVLALVQLVMAIASQNNLIYLFVFSELSVALASMFFTNYNIQKISVKSISAEFCFAQEDNWVTATLETANGKPSYQLNVRWNFKKEEISVPPSVYQIQIPWMPHRRGRQSMPKLVVESSFPFGLLRAWKIERPDLSLIIYPCRRGSTHYPAAARGDQSVQTHGLFYDLRTFQRGDSPQRIDWRASQRAQKLLIRRFEEEASVQLDFRWEQVSHLKNVEDKISQLALWVDRAERDGAIYSLSLGNWLSGRGQGSAHWNLCLEKLALLDERALS